MGFVSVGCSTTPCQDQISKLISLFEESDRPVERVLSIDKFNELEGAG